MTLRGRLSLTSVLVALPLAVGLFLLDERMRLAAMEDTLRQVVEAELASGLLDRCLASEGRVAPRLGPPPPLPPPREPGAGRRGSGPGPRGARPAGRGRGVIEVYMYNRDGGPARADAPALPDESTSTFLRSFVEGRGIQIVFSVGGSGVCAQGLARMPARTGQTRDQMVAVTLAVLSALGAVWIAAGPVLTRLRRLTDGVRRSGESKYQMPVPVEGEEEVRALARAFNEAGAQVKAHVADVQSREQALRQFVANTTHDIAVPLTVLQGHLTALDRQFRDGGRDGGGPVAAAEDVRAAMKESHYMASLLRNLNTATKLGDASVPLEPSAVDLSALVDRVVLRHQTIARASEVELDSAVPDPALVVTADATLLEQAVGNLVDNAVRYNRPGGHVAVVVDRRGDGGFVVSVTDDGPGVPEAELGKLTERWCRGSEARTRRPDGAGLGLAIAAESLARLGFTLTFSRPEPGGLRAEIGGRLDRDHVEERR